MIGKILTGSALTVVIPGRSAPFVIARDHKLFNEVLQATSDNDVDRLLELIDIATKVENYCNGKVTIRDGQVFVGNEAVHNLLADRILEFYAEGLDFGFMAKFLENLMLNPSYQSRQELYLFMENGNMPLTDDGRFLAYKWVRDDYKDCHTGTVDNSVGAKPRMDRGKVDDNRNNTCSDGYHVCTHAYTRFGSRLMIVAVNPKDVVSVPIDYNNAKMRCCEYEVLYEVDPDSYLPMDGGVVSTDGVRKGNDNHLRQSRHSNGRFKRKVA